MSDEIRLTIQVVVSLIIIFGVLWWMWRIPGEAVTASLSATVLAFCSVWIGVAAIGVAGWLWWAEPPGLWAVASVLVWAAALSTGLLALWTYRHTPRDRMPEEVLLQRVQARVGVALGLIAVVMWYVVVIVRLSTLEPGSSEEAPATGCISDPGPVAAETESLRTYHCSLCRSS